MSPGIEFVLIFIVFFAIGFVATWLMMEAFF